MGWFKRRFRRSDDAVEREIAFHIAEQTQANIARGMTADEARRRALVEFGGREQVKQTVREVNASAFFESVAFNLKAAARFLRKSPSFSLAVILTLALGIGANSAVFSAIDAIVWRPLPFPGGDELLRLSQNDAQGREANHFVAPSRLEDWNRMTSTFKGISGYYLDDLSELSGPLPEKVTLALVAPRFLQVLEVSPALGRNFTLEEEHFGGPDAVLISHAFWQRRFHGDPSALGKKLRVGSFHYSIIGIMPASFHFPNRDVDLWAPSPPDAPYAQRRDATWFTVIGRMKPGVTLNEAAADLSTVQSQLGKQFAKPDSELSVTAEPLKETIVGSVRGSLWLLYGSVSLLLLIACSNIAALLLARTAEREHEIAVRFSLGASRRSVITQLLTEVLALALLGAVAGLAVAAAATRGFHLLANTLPRADEITLNGRVVVYSLACAVLTAFLCGLLPAWRGTGTTKGHGLAQSLAHSGRTQVSTRNPMQWILVSVQVTLAVTLLVGAGLLVRSMQAIGRVSPGFDPRHVLTLQVSGSWGETADMKGVVQRIDRTLDGLRTLPGVEAAATSAMLPGVPSKYQQEYKIDGKLDPDRKILADSRWVSAEYFDTVRIPLLVGEACRQASTTSDVVVNRSFANLYLGGTGAVGHTLEQAAHNDFAVTGIVRGIVGDAREQGVNELPVPTVYSCFSAPNPFPNYLIRTHGDPMQMVEPVRRRINELEPNRSVYAILPLEEHLEDAFADDRLRTLLLSLFALTAVSLACIGLYGTLSYLGRLRQREVGVRLALGALRSRIVARFLWQGLRATAVGCVVGLALGMGLSRLLAGMLYGVTALDPLTYVGVLGLVLLVASLASLAPAVRAARVEPVKVLREE
ncbi:MAG TPA: ABC transporter permease [Terracidiphilus sp.]|jgi:predicted permease|nr:ABC transporter permease [Terracidiphilus sp.]